MTSTYSRVKMWRHFSDIKFCVFIFKLELNRRKMFVRCWQLGDRDSTSGPMRWNPISFEAPDPGNRCRNRFGRTPEKLLIRSKFSTKSCHRKRHNLMNRIDLNPLSSICQMKSKSVLGLEPRSFKRNRSPICGDSQRVTISRLGICPQSVNVPHTMKRKRNASWETMTPLWRKPCSEWRVKLPLFSLVYS